MKTFEFNEYLARNGIRVIGVADAAKILGKSRAYASLFLFRDRMLRLAVRGLRYTKDATGYEIASSIAYPSYVSLVSALRFHNLTEQMPNTIYVMTTKRHKPIEGVEGYRIEFRHMKKSMMFGYRKVDGAFVADPEKAVIDMFYLNEFTEYAEEALEGNGLDRGRLDRYAAMAGSASIRKRMAHAGALRAVA